jgi:hypothetical protein
MVTEMEQTVGGAGGVEYAEHSRKSGAKKVIAGIHHFPYQPGATPADSRTIDPINGVVGGASASITLLRGKGYRLVSSVACYFRMSVGASTAVVGDILLPAFTPINVSSKTFDTVSFIQLSAGGVIQAVEVE